MAINSRERPPVSWDDVLAAINPPRQTPEEMYEGALDEITAAWREGQLTEAEADELIRALMGARVRYEIGKMIDYAFTPSTRRGSDSPARGGFSLL